MIEKICRRICANCDKPVVDKYKPFCSHRCVELDLGRWLNESYTIPAVEPSDEWNDD